MEVGKRLRGGKDQEIRSIAAIVSHLVVSGGLCRTGRTRNDQISCHGCHEKAEYWQEMRERERRAL